MFPFGEVYRHKNLLHLSGFIRVGGLGELREKYFHSIPKVVIPNSTCGYPNPNAFHLLQPADSDELPWPGNVIGITILSSWYFCNDQVKIFFFCQVNFNNNLFIKKTCRKSEISKRVWLALLDDKTLVMNSECDSVLIFVIPCIYGLFFIKCLLGMLCFVEML